MIIRYYIDCSTCGRKYITRIQVGYGPRQEHSFHCYQCKEQIRFALNIGNESMALDFEPIANCSEIHDEDGTPIYFSPDFPAGQDDINQELTFPSMDFMHQMLKSPQAEKFFIQPELARNLVTFQQAWTLVQKSWRLRNAGQYQLAEPIIRQFAENHGLADKTLADNLWYFVNWLFPIPDAIRHELAEVAERHRPEFERFLHFYQQNLRDSHRRSQFEILSEYFDSYAQYSQVLMNVRANISLKPHDKVTSVDFSKVKGFYAKTYEFFAGAICIYTCLNNIKEGRPFDQLKSIPLPKYLETDKAKRRDSFAGNKVFTKATLEFDSQVRNASYHNWLFMRPDNYTIEYRSGGTGAIQTLTYTQYLYRCTLMLKQVCNLFSLELICDEIANNIAARNLRP